MDIFWSRWQCVGLVWHMWQVAEAPRGPTFCLLDADDALKGATSPSEGPGVSLFSSFLTFLAFNVTNNEILLSQPCRLFLMTYFVNYVNSNLVQYLLQTDIQKRTEKIQWQIQTLHRDFSPGNPNREKPTYIILIHIVLHCLQYNIHIGASGIQNPNLMTWISPKP